MTDEQDISKKVVQEQSNPTDKDEHRATDEMRLTTFRVPKHVIMVEMDSDEDEETLRDYAYGLVMTALQFSQDATFRKAMVFPSPLAEPWNRYEWDVPSGQRSRQVRACLGSFTAEELRVALSVALEAAHTSVADKVSIEENGVPDIPDAVIVSLRSNPTIVPLAAIDASGSLFSLLASPDGKSHLDAIMEHERASREILKQARENQQTADEALKRAEENRAKAEVTLRHAEELAAEAKELAAETANPNSGNTPDNQA